MEIQLLGHISHSLNDQHDSSSCNNTSGLLHNMRSNTMIFPVIKAWLVSPLHCVRNWSFFYWFLLF